MRPQAAPEGGCGIDDRMAHEIVQQLAQGPLAEGMGELGAALRSGRGSDSLNSKPSDTVGD